MDRHHRHVVASGQSSASLADRAMNPPPQVAEPEEMIVNKTETIRHPSEQQHHRRYTGHDSKKTHTPPTSSTSSQPASSRLFLSASRATGLVAAVGNTRLNPPHSNEDQHPLVSSSSSYSYYSECTTTTASASKNTQQQSVLQRNALRHAFAGTVGAALSMIAIYPLDNLRTRLAVSPRRVSLGLTDAIREVHRREGFRGLYAGVGSATTGVVISWAVYYYLYTIFRQLRRRRRVRLSALDNLMGGIIAGSAATVVSNPIWVANTRQKLQSERRKGLVQVLWGIAREEGIEGLFSGLLPSLVLVLNPSIQFTVYEGLKQVLQTRRAAQTHPQRLSQTRMGFLQDRTGKAAIIKPHEYFFLGLLSKLVATVVTYPYQVVKARAHAPFASPDYTGSSSASLRCLISIVENEGLQGLFKGFRAKLLMTVLTSGIMFMTYETLLKLFTSIEQAADRGSERVIGGRRRQANLPRIPTPR